MTNGLLFKRIMANSPGGVIAQRVQGQPPIFISAGLQDTIFPIAEAGNAVLHSFTAPACAPQSSAPNAVFPAFWQRWWQEWCKELGLLRPASAEA
jgi:hypothetical protein